MMHQSHVRDDPPHPVQSHREFCIRPTRRRPPDDGWRVDNAEKAQTMTASTLRSCTIKDLARMAKRRGVNGWHAMRKDQLVRALLRIAKAKPIESKSAKKIAPPVRRVVAAKNGSAGHPVVTHSRSSLNGSAHHGSAHVNGVRNGSSRSAIARNGAAPSGGVANHRPPRIRRSTPRQLAERARISRRIEQAKVRLSRSKNLAFIQPDEKLTAQAKDRLIVMVRGPFWLHAYWELTAQGIARAQAALGQDWHRARPVLRVLVVTSRNATTTSERVIRDIAVHGGVKNWYVDVQEPPQTYRLEIGYLAAGGKFFSLARSNVVTTPVAAATDTLDAHWQDVLQDCDKIYAMSGGFSAEGSTELQELFEERLHRPMVTPGNGALAAAIDGLATRPHGLRFQIEAEMVIHGMTQAEARVTLQGEPLKLRPTEVSPCVWICRTGGRSFPSWPARKTASSSARSSWRSSGTRKSWNR